MDIQYDFFAGATFVRPANDPLPVIDKVDIRQKLNQMELPVGGRSVNHLNKSAAKDILDRMKDVLSAQDMTRPLSPGVYVNEVDTDFRPATAFRTRYGVVGPDPTPHQYRGRTLDDVGLVYAPYIPLQMYDAARLNDLFTHINTCS